MYLYKKKDIYRLIFLWLFIQPLGLTAVAKPKVRLGMPNRQAQLLLAQYETAKSVYQSEAYADAKSLFGELKNAHHPPLLAPYIHFYYALAYYHNGERSVAKEAFGEIQKKFPDWHKQNEVHYWYALCSFQEGAFGEALASLALIKDQKMAQAILHMKKYFLKQITNHAYLEQLIERFPQEAIIKDVLHKKVAREAYLTQDFALLDGLKEKYHFTDYIYDPLKNLASKHKTAYNVAVFLPFFVEEFNYEACKDQFVIELYQGIQLATERLSQEGIVINLFAFDTKRDKAVTKTLLEQEAMAYMDLIIGPLYPNTIPLVAAFAKKHKINLVNPISDNAAVIHGNPFAFLFQPDLETCAQKAAQLTLSDLSQRSNEEACIAVFYGTEQKETVQATLYKHIVEQRLGKPIDLFLQLSNETIKDFLAQASQQEEKENIENREEEALDLKKDLKKISHIYVPSQNALFVSHIISLCLKLGIKPQIIGHEEWIKKQILNINELKRLPILFLSPNYMDYGRAALGAFRKKFFEKNSTWPSEKSYIGYEMMLFFGRMLGRYGTYFQKKWGDMHYKCVIFQALAYGKHRSNQHIPVVRFVRDKFVVEPCDIKGGFAD